MKKIKIYIRSLLALITLIFIYNSVFPRSVTLYIRPQKTTKGSVIMLILENLDNYSRYALNVTANKVYTYELYNVEEYTMKLIGIPLNSPNKIKIALISNGDVVLEHEIKVYKKNTGESHITIANRFISVPEKVKERTLKERILKVNAKNTIIRDRYFKGEPVFPVDTYRISTPYGFERVYNKRKHRIHYGTDIAAPRGTPIKGIYSGKVLLAGDLYYTGKTVIIHHGDDLISLYAHMDSIKVKQDDIIDKGTIIGAIGSTGQSTGPHLHLSVYIKKLSLDPMTLFKTMSIKD